ncbi:MFS transporter [Brachybacterium fresconis]|uniref:MHS family metabolite:H+ symporter-like MFS transporter n=2 Tax=Brachybacterium fresconis TaxID=173363 RepID=A0ABS4YJC8_9MICO|nr:MHS family metabolite:H+ symporter-like MFS transporter [Brachybacterium fresconis]
MSSTPTDSGADGAGTMSQTEYAANLKRATLSSSVGSALEYFDFAMYGLMTALVFDRLFFSSAHPAMATVAAFGIYGVGFLARPFGGLFFGTIGDRIGRRWVLVATILLMGGASTLIGVLPTYEQVGVLAPILLVVLRLAQGFGAGAEQAGATVLMAEYAPVRRRGFFSALPFIGIQAGTLLASVVFFLLTMLPDEAFMSWGWRLPFLASAGLILIALFIRARLRETPSFIQLEKQEQVAERPIREIFTRGRAGVVVGIGLRMAENGGSYMFQSIALAFVTSAAIGMDRGMVTWGVTLGSLIGIFSVPLTGRISDRVGRVPVYRFGAVFMLIFSVPAWYLLSLGNEVVAIAVIAVGLGVAVNSMLGPQCAMLPELFGNRHRYLGVAMAREISAVLAGGLAGVLGAALLAWTGGNWMVLALYMATLAAITTAATFLVPETRGRDLLRTEDALRISQTECDTATDLTFTAEDDGDGGSAEGTHAAARATASTRTVSTNPSPARR